MNDVDTGALGASGRFARMEAALDRIELKLDLKADVARVSELEGRHVALERMVSDMATGRTVSPLSALYLDRFKKMEETIDKMADEDSNRAAVLTAAKAKADDRYSRLMVAVGVGTLVNLLIASGAAILATGA